MKRKKISNGVGMQLDQFIVEIPVVRAADLARVERMLDRLDSARDHLQHVLRPMVQRAATIAADFTVVAPDRRRSRPALELVPGGNGKEVTWPGTLLHAGHRRILEAAAARQGETIPRKELLTAAGYEKLTRSVVNYLSDLTSRGLLVMHEHRYAVTNIGLAAIGRAELPPPLTTAERLERWSSLLPGKARDMLRHIVDCERVLTIAELARQVGMARRSGGFANYVSLLNTNGLVLKTADGVRAAPWLTTEGP